MQEMTEYDNPLIRPCRQDTLTNCQVIINALSKWLNQIEDVEQYECSAISFTLRMVSNAMEISELVTLSDMEN